MKFDIMANISFNITGKENTTVEVINTIGQTVESISLGKVTGPQLIELSALDLPSGFYLVNVKAGPNSIPSRLTVNK